MGVASRASRAWAWLSALAAQRGIKRAVLATSAAGVGVAGLLCGLLGLRGQQAVFSGTQDLLIHNERAVLERVIQDQLVQLAEHADAVTQNANLMRAVASRNADELDEFSGPVFNRLKKKGVTRLRFFGPDGQLLTQADEEGSAAASRSTRKALESKRKEQGLESAGRQLVLSAAMPCYTSGEFAGVVEVGSSAEAVLQALAKITGTHAGLLSTEGDQARADAVTSPEVSSAAVVGARAAAAAKTWQRAAVGGRPVVLGILPLKDEAGVLLATVLTVQDVSKMESMIARNRALTAAAVLGCAAAVVAVLGLMLSAQLRPIAEIVGGLERAARGDFSRPVQVRSEDELGQVARSANEMIRQMRAVIKEVTAVAEQVAASSTALEDVSKSSSETVSRSVAGLAQVSQNTARVAQIVQGAASLSQQTGALAMNGRQLADAVVETSKSAQGAVVSTAGHIDQLGKRSKEIGQIVDTITRIADQTNLLSLNAAIEAARAGDVGQGFSVVAEEVRKLAEGSAESTSVITRLVREIQQDTQRAVDMAQTANRTAVSGSELSVKAAELFVTINGQITELAKQMGAVAASTQEVAAATEESSASAQEQSAVIEAIAENAAMLSENAKKLKTLIARFSA